MNPTINTNIAEVFNLPIIVKHKDRLTALVSQNISISRSDWDAHETSWDFQTNELVATGVSNIEDAVDLFHSKWESLFYQLHSNEEELNRQFIEIYDLSDELSPEVPLDEITILQQGEIEIEK